MRWWRPSWCRLWGRTTISIARHPSPPVSNNLSRSIDNLFNPPNFQKQDFSSVCNKFSPGCRRLKVVNLPGQCKTSAVGRGSRLYCQTHSSNHKVCRTCQIIEISNLLHQHQHQHLFGASPIMFCMCPAFALPLKAHEATSRRTNQTWNAKWQMIQTWWSSS